MKAVYKHEVSSYLTNMTGWVFAAFLLLFAGLFTMLLCFQNAYSEFEYVLGNMSFVFLIIVPVATMRVVAEERRQKTDVLLYSLPISTTEVIIGKYLALLTILLAPILLMALYPLILGLYGEVNYASAYACLLAFFFLGAALLSVGLFISSITESQVIAAVICFILLLVNYYMNTLSQRLGSTALTSYIGFIILIVILAAIVYLMTKNTFATGFVGLSLIAVASVVYVYDNTLYSNLLPRILENTELFTRFTNSLYGVFSLKDMMILVSVSAAFVFLSIQSMEKRRWS